MINTLVTAVQMVKFSLFWNMYF